MVSVDMTYRRPATYLAHSLANNLFIPDIKVIPDYLCEETGTLISFSSDYTVATINENAMGAHYEAFGYHYLLCFDSSDYEEYIAIHNSKTGDLVGIMTTVDEILVNGTP